jgi:V8-like Glu-specific endopeptidase
LLLALLHGLKEVSTLMAPHYLDEITLDFSNEAVKELRSLLCENYFLTGQVIALVREAGARPASINWDQPMVLVWDDVLAMLHRQGKLRVLLQSLINGPDAAIGARIRELTADQPVTAALPAGAPDIPVTGEDRSDYEKIIEAQPTFLDVSFLARGIELASAVARLLVTLDDDQYFGTAFRIGDDLMLTNHHVLFADSGNPATAVEAWFGYERSFDGRTKAHVSVPGRVETIVGDKAHDWAVVRLAGRPPAGTSVISLAETPPVRIDDRVYIIQHPYGGVKKIGMIHNVVRYIDDDVIRYWTDTEEGSSGSPVFNERWRIVALHHRWIRSGTGGEAKIYNQGRRIERVITGLAASGVR